MSLTINFRMIVWERFHWHTLISSGQNKHKLNSTAYLSIAANHVTSWPQCTHPTMAAQIILNWLLQHDKKFAVLKWPQQTPDLTPLEHIWHSWKTNYDIYHVNMDHNLWEILPISHSATWTEICFIVMKPFEMCDTVCCQTGSSHLEITICETQMVPRNHSQHLHTITTTTVWVPVVFLTSYQHGGFWLWCLKIPAVSEILT